MGARENREGMEYLDSGKSDLRSVYRVKWLGNKLGFAFMARYLLCTNSPYGTSQQLRGSLHEAAFPGQEILRVM